jgi:hypothetical protein
VLCRFIPSVRHSSRRRCEGSWSRAPDRAPVLHLEVGRAGCRSWLGCFVVPSAASSPAMARSCCCAHMMTGRSTGWSSRGGVRFCSAAIDRGSTWQLMPAPYSPNGGPRVRQSWRDRRYAVFFPRVDFRTMRESREKNSGFVSVSVGSGLFSSVLAGFRGWI